MHIHTNMKKLYTCVHVCTLYMYNMNIITLYIHVHAHMKMQEYHLQLYTVHVHYEYICIYIYIYIHTIMKMQEFIMNRCEQIIPALVFVSDTLHRLDVQSEIQIL